MKPSPGLRECPPLCKALGRHWERRYYSFRKGYVQSIWNKEETRVRAQTSLFLNHLAQPLLEPCKPQRTGSSEVCGTPSMTSAIIAALPIPSREIPISIFTSQRAVVYNPDQLLSNYKVLLFQDGYHYGSLPIRNPDFLNCLYLSC